MKHKEPTKFNSGRFLIISTAVLWGLAGVCVKSITWNSMSIMAIRSLASLIMLIFINKGFHMHFTKKNIAGALLCASTGILYMLGIKNTNAATAIVLQYTAPIFVLLFNCLIHHVYPKSREVAIVLIVFLGCVLSFAGNMDSGHLLGNILSLLSGITYALQIIIFSDSDLEADDSLMISNIFCIILCTPFMFFDKGISQTTPSVVLWLIILCFFQYGLANILYARGCKMVSNFECSLLLTIEPVFNPIPVAIFCGETMGPMSFAGFVVVIFGIVAYIFSSRKPAHKSQNY